ncbi:WHG domain-containing protein [Streptomyces sp. NPDC008121]|uniref:WHG domain-containing protein n=1 Tax=Streptomyces sp. NPDC008121 TaxID=3364809 RepID=UPI0036E1B243
MSHGAPRRYFPTHLDLLSAIAREGFAELAARVADTVGTGPGGAVGTRGGDGALPGGAGGAVPGGAEDHPRARLYALAEAYLDFALSRRGMYELMFRHDLLESGRLGLRETSLPLFELLTRLVAHARGDATHDGTTTGADTGTDVAADRPDHPGGAATVADTGTAVATDRPDRPDGAATVADTGTAATGRPDHPGRPDGAVPALAPPAVVAGALWAGLHGIAQLWGWGSLQLATGADEVAPLLRAAVDAHLGPAGRAR